MRSRDTSRWGKGFDREQDGTTTRYTLPVVETINVRRIEWGYIQIVEEGTGGWRPVKDRVYALKMEVLP